MTLFMVSVSLIGRGRMGKQLTGFGFKPPEWMGFK
jgi:hypothetical protein